MDKKMEAAILFRVLGFRHPTVCRIMAFFAIFRCFGRLMLPTFEVEVLPSSHFSL